MRDILFILTGFLLYPFEKFVGKSSQGSQITGLILSTNVSSDIWGFILTFWLLSSWIKCLSCHLTDGGLVLDIADAHSTTKMYSVFNASLSEHTGCLMIHKFSSELCVLPSVMTFINFIVAAALCVLP